MTRIEAIKAMYQYEADREDHMLVDESMEIIDNWYIAGFPSLESLEQKFNIEDLYDMPDLDFKIMVKDQFECECWKLFSDESHKLFVEENIELGDFLNGSDRGNEMKYDH